MLIKIEFIITIYYISAVWTQNPGCRLFDFNNLETDVLVHFTQCQTQTDDLFVIASYEDADVNPFRSNSEYYLTNINSGASCFRTTQMFIMDEYTEIDSVVFLHSNSNDSSVFFNIMTSDPVNGVQVIGESIGTSNEWTKFSSKVNFTANNATVEIRTFTTDDTTLAIEYLYIINPAKAEQYCLRPITTTAATSETYDPTVTIDPTETDSIEDSTPISSTTPTSSTMSPTNKGGLWIALSFTFFLTFLCGNGIDIRHMFI